MPSSTAKPTRRRPASPAPRPSAPISHALPALSTTPLPSTTFAQLGLADSLCKVLTSQGILTPFPIQQLTLPDSLAGRDVLGRGRTGSGKTLAFALPLVSRLATSPSSRFPRALILVPTRELATQVHATVNPLARALGLMSLTVFGGVNQNPQVAALKKGVDVVIACPGRLLDLMSQGHVDLSHVLITVLDEADHMADLGFLPNVKRILDATPTGTQRLLFSATLDSGVDKLVTRYLSSPQVHSADPSTSAVSLMEHHILEVSTEGKTLAISHLASGPGRKVLFTRTKHQAKRLAASLTKSGIPAVDLHGNLSQNARERNLAAFSSGVAPVLVATDIAARGIHVDEVSLVVHIDPPVDHKAYLHRSGRTARAGASGAVVTLMLPEQRKEVELLARQAGISPTTHRTTQAVLTALGLPHELLFSVQPLAAASLPDVVYRSGRTSQKMPTPRSPAQRPQARPPVRPQVQSQGASQQRTLASTPLNAPIRTSTSTQTGNSLASWQTPPKV